MMPPTRYLHSWLSQYPHEKEVLFGPLLGQQPLATRVEGGTLVVTTRMSASPHHTHINMHTPRCIYMHAQHDIPAPADIVSTQARVCM